MEEIVHSYLTKNYQLRGDKIITEEHEIYTIKGEYKFMLLDELATVFSISKDEAKTYANTWAEKIDPNVCLVFYWGYSAVIPSKSGGFGRRPWINPGVYANQPELAEG